MAMTVQGKWTKIEQKGVGTPGPRSGHAISVVEDKLYLFGGEIVANQHIDKQLYVFDLKTQTWKIAVTTGEAPKVSCLGVRMVAVGTKLYIFGGRNENREFNDFYSYDTKKNEWKFLTKLDQDGGPEARTFHSMTADDKNVYVFGGVSKKSGTQGTPYRYRTIDAYNIADGKWSQLPDPGKSYEKRGGAGFVVVQGKLWVIFGFATSIVEGGKSDYESNKIQYFDLASGKWTEVKTSGVKPTARSVFAHAVIGKDIVIFGGEVWPDPNGHLGPGSLSNEGYVLDTETLVWKKLEVDVEGEPKMPVGWTANVPATINKKNGLIMHGGKLPSNLRSEELYFLTL